MRHYLLPLSTNDVELIRNDASLGHRMVMGLFGHIADKGAPRAHAKILWKLQPEGVLIQSVEEPQSGRVVFIKEFTAPPQGGTMTLTYDTTLLKTKNISVPQQLWDSGYRPKTAPKILVPPEERQERAMKILAKNGFEATDINISETKYLPVGRGAGSYRQPYFSIICRGEVTESDTFFQFLTAGTGKCKNYGIGLVLFA